MKLTVTSIGILAVMLAGCASKDERLIASGSFQYLEAAEYKTVEVPEDLDQPEFSDQYALPSVDESAPKNLLGKTLKVASPTLILPLVNGTHVEEGSEDAKVLFDQVNDSEPLRKTVWDTVLTYLEKNNIGVDTFDQEANQLSTNWVLTNYEVETSWYDFSSTSAQTARKYRFDLNIAPHGRTASLSTHLISFIDEQGNSVLDRVDPITKRAEEAKFLNKVIAEYDFGVRLATTQRIAKIRQGFATELGFNSDGESALLVDAIYENTWPRLLLVLRKMGFDVKDLDQSNGLMFVQYTGTEASWWDNMFSANNQLNLKKEQYRLRVAKQGAKTSVTFMDNESKAFDANRVSEIFGPFAEYMATEDLDI